MNFVFAIINKNKKGFEMVKTGGDIYEKDRSQKSFI